MALVKRSESSPEYRDNFDDVLDNFFNWRFSRPSEYSQWIPALDIKETEDAYEVSLETPGMERNELTIQYKDKVLSISGEKKRETKDSEESYHRTERYYGSFSRQVRIGGDVKVEDIKANYKNGVLSVVLPKVEEAKPRSITIE